ncbi:hypothetical protein [Massilia sp. DD77]|uniref:hypothetical protein n=1 Tax=Massilia sp. DD77 TaxID=3109349 RepID=UPI002FFDE85A
MKSFPIRPALALALALGLSACGGGSGKAEYTVAGTVNGLVYPGLVLTTNGMEVAVAPPATTGAAVSYAFPNKLEYGDEYNVQFKQQPLHQTCNFQNGYEPINKNTAGRLARIDVIVNCAVNAYSIGGKITGMTADGLVLANGSTGGTLTLTKATTSAAVDYQMPVAVNYGVTYGVTVITNPAGLNCTIANATGVMGDAKVENINITCVPRT